MPNFKVKYQKVPIVKYYTAQVCLAQGIAVLYNHGSVSIQYDHTCGEEWSTLNRVQIYVQNFDLAKIVCWLD